MPAAANAPLAPLGEILLADGQISRVQLAQMLRLQRSSTSRLGDILCRSEAIKPPTLARALARQRGLDFVDLVADPPDHRLFGGCDPLACLRLGYLPWRKRGGTVIIVIADPDAKDTIRQALGAEFAGAEFALTDQHALRAYIAEQFAAELCVATRDRCPEEFSCRNWRRVPGPRLVAVAGLVVALVAYQPALMLILAIAWVCLANTATTVLRLSALIAHPNLLRRTAPRPLAQPTKHRAVKSRLPRVSVLVPLLHEEGVVGALVEALKTCTYPKPLLDIKLVLEADDHVTRRAISRLTLPGWISTIIVPPDPLRTKPRAMNYALEFCDGEVVGIYDAEDRPAPDQIAEIVAHLMAAGPEVACVQGCLDFYNSRRNWLTRCFTIEYSIWFRVLLRGVERLGLPIPLGGTTVFFRREALEKIGAWDAHNVTEDADLGMRLARLGYRCEMVATTTMEEANCQPRNWIRQRARWLKGYAITWATHMRTPLALYRALGLSGFLAFQTLFLGAITAYLATPLIWMFWGLSFGFDVPVAAMIPTPMIWVFFGTMLTGQILMLTIAAIAVWPRERRHLLIWVLSLPFYWPLGAIAAWRAVGELFYAPFYWHKTKHGL